MCYVHVLITENLGVKDEAFVLSKILKCICPFVGGKKMSNISFFLFLYLFLPPLAINFCIQSYDKVAMTCMQRTQIRYRNKMLLNFTGEKRNMMTMVLKPSLPLYVNNTLCKCQMWYCERSRTATPVLINNDLRAGKINTA